MDTRDTYRALRLSFKLCSAFCCCFLLFLMLFISRCNNSIQLYTTCPHCVRKYTYVTRSMCILLLFYVYTSSCMLCVVWCVWSCKSFMKERVNNDTWKRVASIFCTFSKLTAKRSMSSLKEVRRLRKLRRIVHKFKKPAIPIRHWNIKRGDNVCSSS